MTGRCERVAQEVEALIRLLRLEFLVPMVASDERRLRHAIALMNGAIEELDAFTFRPPITAPFVDATNGDPVKP
jgi:hypothetical protein